VITVCSKTVINLFFYLILVFANENQRNTAEKFNASLIKGWNACNFEVRKGKVKSWRAFGES
jgi:hypothetical protein